MPIIRLLLIGSLLAWPVGLQRGMADDGNKLSERPANVRVAGIVLKWIRGEKDVNYGRIEPLIREAASHGAQLVCTTECCLDGYAIADKSIPLNEYRALGEPIPEGEYVRRLAALADELDIHLVAGMLEADGPERYNAAVVVGPDGGLIGKYRKQRLGHEAVRNIAGRESSVFETPYGKLGVMICADRRDPDVVNRFCERGADFLLCPSGGMFGPKSNDHILQARSRETGRHIIFVHPAEFLVTGPEGSILQRELVGDRLLVPAQSAGNEEDSRGVFYFDLPVADAALSAEPAPARRAPATASAPAPLPAGDWNDHGFTEAQREQVRQAFRRGIERKFIPGGSLLLIHKGEVVLREAFGEADLAAGRPFRVETPCRIASLTKPHTATVLALLADRGALALDDPIDKHLPAFRGIRVRGGQAARRAPTIAECLSHTAGFPGNNALKAGRFDVRLDGELADVVADLATKELLAEPGTRYAYSRLGYITAGRIAEVVTGKSFPDIMRDVLLEPIGAVNTHFATPDAQPDQLSVVYERTPDGFRPRQGEPLGTALNPGGSLVATLDGVGRLMLLHRNRGIVNGSKIVSAETLARMYVPQPATPGTGYGLGFNIVETRSDGSARRIRHTGASGTFASLDFEADLIVVILTQVPQAQTTRWRQNLLQTIQMLLAGRRPLPAQSSSLDSAPDPSTRVRAWLDEHVPAVLLGHDPSEAVPAVRIKQRMQALCGEYETYRGLERLRVQTRQGVLYLETQDPFDDAPTATPLIPDDPRMESTTFYSLHDGRKSPAEFQRREDGAVDLFVGRYRYRKRR